MKKLNVLILLFFSFLSLEASVGYLDEENYCDMQDSNFVKVRQFIEAGEDYKAFYLLQKIVKKSCRTSSKAQALIVEGWLAYRYRLFSQAIDSWEKALDLLGEPHPWVNLWLACCYLSQGNILRAGEVFAQVPSPPKDASLYLTLQSRLSSFRVPLKEAGPYLDFVSFLGADSYRIFIGNLYGGLCSFDVRNNQITILETAVPSMVSNPLKDLMEIRGGFYLAKKSGLYYLPKEGKSHLIALPNIKEAAQRLKTWVSWGDNLVGLWDREGLWLYKPDENTWQVISQDVKPDTFLIKVGEGDKEQVLFLNKQSQLSSISRKDLDQLFDLQVFSSISLPEEWLKPVKEDAERIYLASAKGDLVLLSLKSGEWQSQTLLNSDKKVHWLAFWKGKDSPYLSVINCENKWQRLNKKGQVVDSILFPFPILNGLINYACVGASYVWVNIASEVYALSETLLFAEKK